MNVWGLMPMRAGRGTGRWNQTVYLTQPTAELHREDTSLLIEIYQRGLHPPAAAAAAAREGEPGVSSVHACHFD
jgi:hypothetical protein